MKLISLILLCASLAGATTKLRLHDSPSTVTGCKAMDISLGPPNITAVLGVTTTTAQTGAIDIPMTKTAGGSALVWCSEPIATASGSVGTGTITFNIYGGESGTSVNAAFRGKLFYCASPCTSLPTLTSGQFALGEMAAELNATLTTARNWTAGTVTPQAVSAGDRLVLVLSDENCNNTSGCPTGNMAAGTTTIHYDGPTDAADGSSWVQTTENLTFTPDGGSGGTPSIVQWTSTPDFNNAGSSGAGASIKIMLPGPTQAGNAIAVAIYRNAAGGTITMADDHSNAYYLGPICQDSSVYTAVYLAQNVAAGTRVITLTHSANTFTYFAAMAAEITNVASSGALDASTCAVSGATLATSIPAGSMTTLSNGDFLMQFDFTRDNGGDQSTSGFTAGSSPWALLTTTLNVGHAIQTQTQTTAGAISATFAYGSNAYYETAAIALKSSTAGNPAPAGLRIKGIQTETVTLGQTSPYASQWEGSGNLTAIVGGGASGDYITQVHSAGCSEASNNFLLAASVNTDSGGNTGVTYYCENVTGHMGAVSSTLSQTALGDSVYMFFDIVGAATSSALGQTEVKGIGSKTGVTPVNAATGGLTSGSLSITPTTATSLVVSYLGVSFNTVNVMNTSGCLLQNGYLSTNTSNTTYYENNGWATCLNHATTAIAHDWTLQSGIATDTGPWEFHVVEFLSPSTGTVRRRVIVSQ